MKGRHPRRAGSGVRALDSNLTIASIQHPGVLLMLGKQGDDTELFQLVTMDALVPANHRLRRLKSVLDLSFVDKCVASLYSSVGRRSVDPEVVVEGTGVAKH